MTGNIARAYESARERYSVLGVDTEAALERLSALPLSVQCWQGDDVSGFEAGSGSVSEGGIQVTGNYPGRARDANELRADLDFAFSMIPGAHAANIHAIYAETGAAPVTRDSLDKKHFSAWIEWARANGIGLDFNATLFAHPLAKSGFTLSSKDSRTRAFWIEHVRRCRSIAEVMGRGTGRPCIHNLWIPDGSKDSCVDRAGYRALLVQSLDEIYGRRLDKTLMRDSVESKLFGIGSESFVVGSHEFYLGYAFSRNVMPCLDMGHFHPTESVADKISGLLPFAPEILLHVSRGVRWDSDHIVSFDDSLRDIACEVVRSGALDRVHFAMDYFDASVNRIGAWVIGARATLKALLVALLEPRAELVKREEQGHLLGRLSLLEELKTMPFGAVWDRFCQRNSVPTGETWLDDVTRYERDVLDRRR